MPKTRLPRPPEFREGAVRLALTSGERTSEIAAAVGVSYESLRKYIKQHLIDGGIARGVTWSEQGTLLAHVRQNPRLDTDVTFLVVLSWPVFVWGAVLLAQLTACRSRIS